MKQVKILAGIPSELSEHGRFFRIFTAQQEVNIRFESTLPEGTWSVTYPVRAGIALDFSKRPTPFNKITIESPVNQTIEVFAGLDMADESSGGSGSMQVTVDNTNEGIVIRPKLSLTDTTNGHEVLPYSPTRAQATVFIDGDCYIGNKTDGILVSGLFTWENKAALTLVPVNNPTECRILEETA